MEKETKFNEKDFTNLLLSLLCKNGTGMADSYSIYKISGKSEKIFSKK